jgi:hypothetical protein
MRIALLVGLLAEDHPTVLERVVFQPSAVARHVVDRIAALVEADVKTVIALEVGIQRDVQQSAVAVLQDVPGSPGDRRGLSAVLASCASAPAGVKLVGAADCRTPAAARCHASRTASRRFAHHWTLRDANRSDYDRQRPAQ